MRIGIFGAGGLGRELVLPLRLAHPDAELVFIDDRPVGECGDLPVISLADATSELSFIAALGDGNARSMAYRRCREAGLLPHTFIDNSAFIGPRVKIGEGSMICGNTLVTTDCEIGRGVHINWYGVLGHDCRIGDFATIGPRAMCLGNVHVGAFAYIGATATIRNGTSARPIMIGEGAVVGMGALVTKDVPPHTTVVGNPARPLNDQPAPAPERRLWQRGEVR
jgi:sugar O-acyltransferase (sialic acid O-acetyltransferase NeuD family)